MDNNAGNMAPGSPLPPGGVTQSQDIMPKGAKPGEIALDTVKRAMADLGVVQSQGPSVAVQKFLDTKDEVLAHFDVKPDRER